MLKILKKASEWIGHFEVVQSVIHTEFVRTIFLPTVWAMLTLAGGYLGGVPVMWILMATALSFMAVTQGILRADELRERKNPLNKLNYIGTQFGLELDVATVPVIGNRHQRRAHGAQQPSVQTLAYNQVQAGVPRTLDKGQVGVDVKNNASFPISCILQNATTEVAGLTPPRAAFPKPATTVQPGGTVRISDDAIIMNHLQCGRLVGKMNLHIKYGLPGKERFDLHLVGDLDISMQDFGLVTQIATMWKN